MIVRILGEGQFEVSDDSIAELNRLDAELEAALDAEEATFRAALHGLLAAVRAAGTPVADEELDASDVILPFADATADDVRDLLSDEGLIPG